MTYLFPVLFSTMVLLSCLPNNQSDNDEDRNKDNCITIEATALKDSTNTAITTWYNGTYLSKLMDYSGLKGALRIKNLGGINTDFVPLYWTFFMSATKDELLGLPGSPQAIQGNNDLATNWPDSQIVRIWNVSYEKLKSWENDGAEKPMQYITVVPTVVKDEYEEAVNNWEIKTHIPWLMKYKGLSKVVRYKRIEGTGTDVIQMPKYIELFYYCNKSGYDGQESDETFTTAQEDLKNTWKNGELEIPWVYHGQIVKEVMR